MTSEYKAWQQGCGFRDNVFENLMAQPRLGKYSILEEEEEEEELADEDFFVLAELFKGGDSKALRRSLDYMMKASYCMTDHYIPAFAESGLPAAFTSIVAMDNVSPEVQVRIILIITNLTSRIGTPEYGEALVNQGIIHQLAYHVIHMTNHEAVFWSIRCLTNLSCISLAIRDQVLDAFTPTQILHLGQSRDLDAGSHTEFLNMLRSIICDLDAEQIDAMLDTISTFSLDFLGKKTVMLKLVALLSRYEQFHTYFANAIPEMRKLFMKATKYRHLELLLMVFSQCFEKEPDQYFPIIEKIHNTLGEADESVLPAYASFICHVLHVEPTILTREQMGSLLEGFMQRREGLRQKTKQYVAEAILWLIHTMRDCVDIEVLIDYLSFDNAHIHHMAVAIFAEYFEACEAVGDHSYRDALFEVNGLEELMTLRDESDDPELIAMLDHIIDMANDTI